MTPYDVAEWAEFANTVAGGAAALAGLMFVGLSLNLTEVLAFPGVAARAAATLGLTVAILLLAVFVAISLWCQAGGGLYWLTAAVAMDFASRHR